MRYFSLGLVTKWVCFYSFTKSGELKRDNVMESLCFFLDFELKLFFSFTFLLIVLLINILRVSFDYHMSCY
jgi:hypothetical protein